MELPPLKLPSGARRMSLRGALPVPAQGGRSLWVMLVPRVALLTLPLFDGRLDELLPKPEGARPRSVALPCASQPREFGRLAPFTSPRVALLNPPRLPFSSALVRMFEFGLSPDSSRCRADALPLRGELLKRPELVGMPLFRPRFPEFSKPRPPLPGRSVAGRIVPELKERVGMCEAPAAGVLRATTGRF